MTISCFTPVAAATALHGISDNIPVLLMRNKPGREPGKEPDREKENTLKAKEPTRHRAFRAARQACIPSQDDVLGKGSKHTGLATSSSGGHHHAFFFHGILLAHERPYGLTMIGTDGTCLFYPLPRFGSFRSACVYGWPLPASALASGHYSGFAPRVRTFGFAGYAPRSGNGYAVPGRDGLFPC